MSPDGSVATLIDLAEFEARTFDPAAFDHAAHVHVAWRYLQHCDLGEAIRRFTQVLRRLTTDLGIPDKYHETISWFFLIAIAERCANRHDEDWESFCRDNPDLFRGADLLRRHYSTNRLQSPLARRQFVLPDLPWQADDERGATRRVRTGLRSALPR